MTVAVDRLACSFPVLDKGFVRLVEYMGGDRAVVQAARVSYALGLKTPTEDKKLIKYLLNHKHTTPFEQAQFKFHVKAPVFVARQWFRHRIASYNEMSQRYTEIKDEFYIPSEWRKQSKKNKQGSEVSDDLCSTTMSVQLREDCAEAHRNYRWYLDQGVAKELARLILPINIYTEFYVSLNAHALMHFFRLRSEDHAQWEVRQYSDTMFDIFRVIMPWTAEAFLGTIDSEKYIGLNSVMGEKWS